MRSLAFLRPTFWNRSLFSLKFRNWVLFVMVAFRSAWLRVLVFLRLSTLHYPRCASGDTDGPSAGAYSVFALSPRSLPRCLPDLVCLLAPHSFYLKLQAPTQPPKKGPFRHQLSTRKHRSARDPAILLFFVPFWRAQGKPRYSSPLMIGALEHMLSTFLPVKPEHIYRLDPSSFKSLLYNMHKTFFPWLS